MLAVRESNVGSRGEDERARKRTKTSGKGPWVEISLLKSVELDNFCTLRRVALEKTFLATDLLWIYFSYIYGHRYVYHKWHQLNIFFCDYFQAYFFLAFKLKEIFFQDYLKSQFQAFFFFLSSTFHSCEQWHIFQKMSHRLRIINNTYFNVLFPHIARIY